MEWIELKEARLRRRWSRRELAERVGVEPNTIYRWEHGISKKPRGYNLRQLLDCLGMTAMELGLEPVQQSTHHVPEPALELLQNKAASLQKAIPSLPSASLSFEHAIRQNRREVLQQREGEILIMDPLRRATITGLLSLISGSDIPFEWLEQLASPRSSSLKEDEVHLFQQLLESGWGLCNSGEWDIAEQVLDSFLPHMIQKAPKQRDAAILAARGLVLRSILQAHRMKLAAMIPLCEQARIYALYTGDHTTICAALNGLAVARKYNGQFEKSFEAYVEALCYCDEATAPLIRSRIYAGAAAAFARHERKQEADLYINLAYEYFPDHPLQDPHYLSSDHGLYMVAYYQGSMYLALGQPREAYLAFDRYKMYLPADEVPARNRLEIVNHQGKAAILFNSLEQYEFCLQEGIAGALELQSEKRLSELVEIFRKEMSVEWRAHPQIKPLIEQYPFLLGGVK